MSVAKFYLTETKVMTTFEEGADEPDVVREDIFENDDFTVEELDDHIKKMSYSNIHEGYASNNSHDNHDRDYFENGIETVHELRLEKITDASGSVLDRDLAAKVFDKRIRMANEPSLDNESSGMEP